MAEACERARFIRVIAAIARRVDALRFPRNAILADLAHHGECASASKLRALRDAWQAEWEPVAAAEQDNGRNVVAAPPVVGGGKG